MYVCVCVYVYIYIYINIYIYSQTHFFLTFHRACTWALTFFFPRQVSTVSDMLISSYGVCGQEGGEWGEGGRVRGGRRRRSV
jgi:hypothetical protein